MGLAAWGGVLVVLGGGELQGCSLGGGAAFRTPRTATPPRPDVTPQPFLDQMGNRDELQSC